jgi:hypothetical protein
MVQEETGSGPALDRNFDFRIDSSGDIKASNGVSELEKDLAFNSAVLLQDFIGKVLTPTTRQEVNNTLESILEQEERIDSVQNITVEQVEYGFDVEVVATVDDEKTDLVFPVGDNR